MLSPRTYDRFIRPANERVLQALGGGGIHWCGSGQHWQATFLDTEGLTCVDWGNPERLNLASWEPLLRERRLPVSQMNWTAEAFLAQRPDRVFPTGAAFTVHAASLEESRQDTGYPSESRLKRPCPPKISLRIAVPPLNANCVSKPRSARIRSRLRKSARYPRRCTRDRERNVDAGRPANTRPMFDLCRSRSNTMSEPTSGSPAAQDSTSVSPLVYLDYNCFQCGFDDPAQVRIQMEALACQEVFARAAMTVNDTELRIKGIEALNCAWARCLHCAF